MSHIWRICRPSAYAKLFQRLTSIRLLPKLSYAAGGEDCFVAGILRELNIPMESYLDIGANDPHRINNTYAFYEAGAHGVAVEPNPELAKRFQRARPRDIVLNVAVGDGTATSATMHLFDCADVNTLDGDLAKKFEAAGHKKLGEMQVPLMTVSEILNKHFAKSPTLISIDAEGMDFEILRNFPFTSCRPVFICVETSQRPRTYLPNVQDEPNAMEDLMSEAGYIRVAISFSNTIFMDYAKWRCHRDDETHVA
jgi:FkbM family methyltransferase